MKAKLKTILIAVSGILIVAYLGMSYIFSSMIITPYRLDMEGSKAKIEEKWNNSIDHYLDRLAEPENFVLTSEVDQIKLKGWYFKQPDTTRCGVVMAHGWNNNRTGLLKYASIFWECGCDLVMYDHRGHFQSGGEYGTGGVKEKQDLITVTNWFQEKTGLTDAETGWFGESWGGATVLQAGGLDKDVAWIIADAPFQDWYTAIFERADRRFGSGVRRLFGPTVMWMVSQRVGVDYREASALNAAPNIVEPVLINHSKTDTKTASRQSANISAKLSKEQSSFHHAEWGADHCLDAIINPEGYKKMVLDFIQKNTAHFGAACL